MTFIDGNAAAGPLSQVFALDVSNAKGRCLGCGDVSALAQAHVYGQSPGLVLRCAFCESVLARFVTSGERSWLDLSGLSYLQF
jgi:hypothetical protein